MKKFLESKSKKWLGVFFSTFIVLILSVGALNYSVDSLLLFKSDELDSIAIALNEGKIVAGLKNTNERLLKKKFIEHSVTAPSVVALGSSRARQIRKEMLGAQSFQNYGVGWGDMWDWMGLLQSHKDKHNSLPSVALICVDPWVFNKNDITTRDRVLTKERRKWKRAIGVEYGEQDNMNDKYSKLFSFEYAVRNFKESLVQKDRYYVVDNIEVDDFLWLSDGSNMYDFKSRKPDSKEVEKHAKSFASGRIESLNNFYKMDNVDAFKKTILYLLNNDVRIIFYLPPYNPISWDIMMKRGMFNMLLEVENYLINFAKRHNIKLLGSYNPHNLNLSHTDFSDGFHALDKVYENVFKNALD